MRKSKGSKPYPRAKVSSKPSRDNIRSSARQQTKRLEANDKVLKMPAMSERRQENQAKIDAVQGDMKPIRPAKKSGSPLPTTLGAERLTNPTFSGNITGWTASGGWTWFVSAIFVDGSGDGELVQSVAVTPGAKYLLVVDVGAAQDGPLPRLKVLVGGAIARDWVQPETTVSIEVVAGSSTMEVGVGAVDSAAVDAAYGINSISLKEIT